MISFVLFYTMTGWNDLLLFWLTSHRWAMWHVDTLCIQLNILIFWTIWYNGCPKRANDEDQFPEHDQRLEPNCWFLSQIFPTQYLRTFTSIMLVTKLGEVVAPGKLMIGIDFQVKDHGQYASSEIPALLRRRNF